jgi:hypothetical protein
MLMRKTVEEGFNVDNNYLGFGVTAYSTCKNPITQQSMG